MTGWDLLESLAELADKEPNKLDAPIYAIWDRNISQTIAFKPQKITYKFDTKSNNSGLVLETKGDK